MHHQGIPGQAGTQYHFPYPEKHQNGILLPHHLHDLRTERGIEEVAKSAGIRRDERSDTLPRQRNAVPSAQRSGGGASTHPQKVPKMAGCTPGVPSYCVPRSAAFQCDLSADDLRRRCEGRSGHHRTRYGRYAGKHLRPYPAVLPCGVG